MIPRFKPQYGWREWLAAWRFTRGNIPAYEAAFARKFGVEHGTMFPHGRSGMYALFKVWGLEKAEIVCPAYTCVVVQHAVVLSGNVPVFVDCPEGEFNMDLGKLEAAITEQTRCVVATHLFGYPMDLDALGAIVARAEEKYGHKIYILQDVAHSYGTEWNGRLVTEYGDAAIFGCNISKLINSIFGGMIISNDGATMERLRAYRESHFKRLGWKREVSRLLYFMGANVAFNNLVYGMVNWLERKGFLDYFVKYYDEGAIDFPADWDVYPAEIEARVGLVQLERYDQIIATRRRNAERIIAAFEGRNDIQFLPFDPHCTYSHLVALVEDREAWVEEYRKTGTQLGILIEYSVPYMKAYQPYARGEYPVSARYANHAINFPIWN